MPVDDVRSIPVAAFAHRGSPVIATDAGEWLAIASGDRLEALPATGPISDMVEMPDGTLTVACWEPVLKQLRDGVWTELALSSPATALAVTARGLVIADTSGGLSLLAGSSRVPVQEVLAPEPIVALQPHDGGVVGVGASGSLEVTPWPGADGGLVAIHTGSIGRAHAIFPGIRAGTTFVAGARGLGILEKQRLMSVTTELGDRVSGVAVFADRGRALAYTDSGEAWIVDEGLVRATKVRLGDAEVAGAAAGADGTVLVWTTRGALHVVGHDGASWLVTDGGVVLALPEPERTRGSQAPALPGRAAAPQGAAESRSIAIHWSASGGARVTRGHVAWN